MRFRGSVSGSLSARRRLPHVRPRRAANHVDAVAPGTGFVEVLERLDGVITVPSTMVTRTCAEELGTVRPSRSHGFAQVRPPSSDRVTQFRIGIMPW